ncbi:unnamed protein product (macronuclear) [Paramecium tetraurelia]|uniref:U2A'/phosphoprotein 32 family A C-terminal domain-containing protein n=1 Tax=Paramecium tetraurelia TaxID=5888 RepID=A0CSA8_PARTE|nr:uncharacterized protein GSPATT00009947001 [Paramecium tetraurelia]CAK73675.1 unnamed protein product [Paramecium tetraurelia]|eukprot:XP_001441072.1 hypothetical protein (macronuclear) [Paramecium tetraurelia strain d4-2]
MAEKIINQIKKQAEDQGELEELDIQEIRIEQLTQEITESLKKHQKLKTLAITCCGLKQLNGLPAMDQLEVLMLEGNCLDGSALKYISENFKNIICLSLAENQIKSLEELQVLKNLSSLQQLDLSDNEVEQQAGYHQKIFEMLPNLQVLDNKNKDGKGIEYSDEDNDFEEGIGSDSEFNDDEDEDEDEEESEDESPKPQKKTKK